MSSLSPFLLLPLPVVPEAREASELFLPTPAGLQGCWVQLGVTATVVMGGEEEGAHSLHPAPFLLGAGAGRRNIPLPIAATSSTVPGEPSPKAVQLEWI